MTRGAGVLSFFLSIHLPQAQDGRASLSGAGSPPPCGWLRWRRRFTARPVWPFFSFPRRPAAIIPRDGKGIEGWRCVRNRIAIISMYVAVVLQFWYRSSCAVRPLRTCLTWHSLILSAFPSAIFFALNKQLIVCQGMLLIPIYNCGGRSSSYVPVIVEMINFGADSCFLSAAQICLLCGDWQF